jgi:hypothetical protein
MGAGVVVSWKYENSRRRPEPALTQEGTSERRSEIDATAAVFDCRSRPPRQFLVTSLLPALGGKNFA